METSRIDRVKRGGIYIKKGEYWRALKEKAITVRLF
jgi:hypothetical protein